MIRKILITMYDKMDSFFPRLKLKKKMREIESKKPSLVSILRKKESIKVLFIIPCLSKWKTESLYLEMLNNPRFEPIIGVALMTLDYPSEAVSKYNQLTEYLHKKHYNYVELCSNSDLEIIKPDIIFHQEASGGGILKSLSFYNYTKCLYCYITYGLFIPSEIKLINTPYHNCCWKVFFESPLLVDYSRKVMDNHGCNTVFTGVPMTDQLLSAKENFTDPWKKTNCKRRIIWAPHHSILQSDLLNYGTFLLYADYMINMAKKYCKDVQWAFKPHPVLRSKLNKIWGKNKTDDYYNQWAGMDNTQLEEGEYVSLFKYSDALIHDSCSFMVEYLYMNKPCMFLVKNMVNEFNPFGQKCFEQYYLGHNASEVESFILNVINADDSFKTNREIFIQNYLLPPNGTTASKNIISEILGV